MTSVNYDLPYCARLNSTGVRYNTPVLVTGENLGRTGTCKGRVCSLELLNLFVVVVVLVFKLLKEINLGMAQAFFDP